MKEGFLIQEELKKLPHKPGVYLMHDSNEDIIYVGKAKDLNSRVRSYFRENVGRGPWIDRMISLIDYFEYIVTDSELEALVLENNLIKEHRPKYNTMLRDDKTYPYIRVTLGEEYPRVLFSREVKRDKSKYFGPFTSAAAVKDTIELINRLYGLRTCNNKVKEGSKVVDRPCLNYHIGQCSAPCMGDILRDDYAKKVDKALEFLGGNYNPIIRELEEDMKRASMALDFEKAASLRDLLQSVRSCAQKQKITDGNGEEDRDFIAIALGEEDGVIQVFFIRGGRMIGREHFFMKIPTKAKEAEVLSDFIKQYYGGTPFIPGEIFTSSKIDDEEAIAQYLRQRRGGSVRFLTPLKGQKEKLLELAKENARLVLEKDKDRIRREEGRTIGAVKEIEDILGLKGIVRIEAFDISNTSGYQNVGSMVVFEKGKPKKNDYRKFRIKSVDGPDDYQCMKEVLTRRLAHEGFPDLLLMDGGKGQVNVALEVLNNLKLKIPVCGMVKDDNHRTRGLYYNNEELPIAKNSEGFKLITRIQDEAHRFAITYHRSLRSKEQTHSVLDDIKGIGPSRRKALMRHFAGIEEIKEADIAKLMEIPEINKATAMSIYSFFHSDMIK